jgi:uncharacterized protein (DUF362 family)
MNTFVVCLSACHTYEPQVLIPLLQQQLDIMRIPAELTGKKILLKPNLLSAKSPALACSEPRFVAAAASAFLQRGARVVLGDSPAFGSAKQVLQRQGFTSQLSGLAVEHVPFRSGVSRLLDCGVRVTVAAEALNCDYFINMPRIKAHDQMGLTMAVKNVFGIIVGARKAWLHMRQGASHQQFAQMILDLQSVLPQGLVLADGIEVMHRRGPMKGKALLLGCLAASRSAVALDRALIKVLEAKVEQVPLAMEAVRRQIQGAHLEDLSFPQRRPEQCDSAGFVLPAQLAPVRFQPLQYLNSSIKRVLSA